MAADRLNEIKIICLLTAEDYDREIIQRGRSTALLGKIILIVIAFYGWHSGNYELGCVLVALFVLQGIHADMRADLIFIPLAKQLVLGGKIKAKAE
jgi:hypothetical protein